MLKLPDPAAHSKPQAKDKPAIFAQTATSVSVDTLTKVVNLSKPTSADLPATTKDLPTPATHSETLGTIFEGELSFYAFGLCVCGHPHRRIFFEAVLTYSLL